MVNEKGTMADSRKGNYGPLPSLDLRTTIAVNSKFCSINDKVPSTEDSSKKDKKLK